MRRKAGGQGRRRELSARGGGEQSVPAEALMPCTWRRQAKRSAIDPQGAHSGCRRAEIALLQAIFGRLSGINGAQFGLLTAPRRAESLDFSALAAEAAAMNYCATISGVMDISHDAAKIVTLFRASDYLMNSISWYEGSGQRSSATRPSSSSA